MHHRNSLRTPRWSSRQHREDSHRRPYKCPRRTLSWLRRRSSSCCRPRRPRCPARFLCGPNLLRPRGHCCRPPSALASSPMSSSKPTAASQSFAAWPSPMRHASHPPCSSAQPVCPSNPQPAALPSRQRRPHSHRCCSLRAPRWPPTNLALATMVVLAFVRGAIAID